MKEKANKLKLKPKNEMKLATHLRSWVDKNQVTVDNQMPFYKLGSSHTPIPEPELFPVDTFQPEDGPGIQLRKHIFQDVKLTLGNTRSSYLCCLHCLLCSQQTLTTQTAR